MPKTTSTLHLQKETSTTKQQDLDNKHQHRNKQNNFIIYIIYINYESCIIILYVFYHIIVNTKINKTK